MKPSNKVNDDTRERILDAALELFARDGYAEVSVREITAKADTHLSAINYHFGDKRNLYMEVFRSRWMPRARKILDSLEQATAQGPVSPDKLIGMMTRGFISGFPSYDQAIQFHQLIAREMAQPGEAYDFIFTQVQRPMFDLLIKHLKPELPPETSYEQVVLHIFSIFSQMLHFNFGRRLVTRISGREYDQEFTDLIVEHIVTFSLKGMGIAPRETANA